MRDRTFETGDGVWVFLKRLEMRSPYYGAVEITSLESANRYLLKMAREKYRVVVGVEELERSLASEEVCVELMSEWLPDDEEPDPGKATYLTLLFFQAGKADPFVSLAKHLRQIDWGAIAHIESWD